MHEVFSGSISKEEYRRDSVPNHDNEHVVAWEISLLFCVG